MKVDSQDGTKTGRRPAQGELVSENVYVFPVTFAQQRLWFLDQLEPNGTSYSVPWSIRMTGKLNARALESSLNEIVRRHEVLRTTFSAENGHAVQVVAPTLHVPLPVIDFSLQPDREQQAQQAALQEAQKPVDLKNGPLVRAKLLRLGQEEHVLLLTMHHIIFDGWSRRILVRELTALYEAFSSGRPSPLPELPLQYADYAVWQRKHLQGKILEKQLSYWKQNLSGAPATLELPTDRPRPAVQSFRGAVRAFSLPGKLTEDLNGLSRQQSATLFMTLLAGFQALLARYSGQDDIVVGAPIANRNRAELEGLIGFFANTLVLRTQVSPHLSFAELLGRVKEVALGAYAHQDMPFEKLVEELRPERSLSHNPLFQVLFSLQNAPRQAFELSGLQLRPLEAVSATAKFDISLFLVESPEGLRGRMEYNTDLFDAETIERLLEHYQVLLEAAVADPAQPVSALPLLAATERRQVVADWNATEFDYPRQLCLHQVFEQQAERAPQAIACVCDDQQLSYGELNVRANQVAHFLKQRGVGRGQRVGIFIERSLDMMVGLLGIQKSGAAYVPLDPAYPAERLRLTLDDAQVPVLLTQQSLLSAMPEHQAEVVCLDRDWAKMAAHPKTNLDSGVKPEDLVYVIFTSGSTGRPKGVQVPHGAVVNLLSFMAQELRMGPQDVFPALASFAFDMCIPELYLALVSGGRVVIGNRHLAANGEELAALLRKTGATIVHATPTTWSLLLEAGFSGKGLKRVIGAEPLPRELCSRLLAADSSLYNFYGPTETTVWSAFHHFRSPDEPIVVGRPLANTQIYILDAQLNPTAIGVPGEIHIAGDGVTCGYLNRPEMTAEKFIADPFSKKPGTKMYKTGDLGRYLPDGRIEFQGRADHQVKVRGYRIELGEIEAVLGKHPAVQDGVVIAREDVVGDKRLVGYVIPLAGQKMNAGDLRTWVKERLPEYMVPVAWVEMERFPLSPNGKVDRKHLPTPDYTRADLGGEYQGARTPAEEVIAAVWAEVLKLDQVGVHDNFFDLGGHSLLATQVVSRIRQAFAVELPLRSLFEAPTVAGLAERVESLQRQQQGLEAPPMERVRRDQSLPLSFAQQRLWFLDQLEPNNPLYNVPYVVRLAGKLNAAVLEKSLNEIVRRHESLRTRFETVNDQPVQVIAPSLSVPLERTDLSSLPAPERESEALRLAIVEVKRPFQLATGPLLRASLYQFAGDDHVLVLNTHHIISDRWSLGVLSQDLVALYEAFLANQPSPLGELPIQYADYSLWQREFLSGETLDKQLAYWKQQLAGAPASLDLPSDRPRPPLQSYHGAQASMLLPQPLLEQLKQLSRREGVTFFMTLLAAFDVLLSRYSGSEDIVIGSPIAGRNRAEVEKLIGFFVNTLVLRADLAGDPSFRQLLSRVRETALGAYAHQDLPFEKLVEELRPERDLSRNPLFQVMLILQNVPAAGQKMAELTAGPFPLGGQSAKFDLTLIAAEKSDGLRLAFEYNTDLFDPASIDRMLAQFEVLLQAVVADPAEKISSLTILTAAEKQQILTDWNSTQLDYPRSRCLHELFAEQAKQAPERVAVEFGEQQITYGELHARSNQLARYLQKRGVGPEVRVGLVVERSIDMVVGLLGILKAGGAYVPLDPAYPRERIAFVLQDAKSKVLVTQQSLLSLMPESAAEQIRLDADWNRISRESADELPSPVTPQNLAYVLYTSGSTGKPKGVQIEHRNLVNFLSGMRQEPGLSADDVLVAVTTLSFDIAGLELYLPLVSGAKVVLASREQAADGKQLLHLLEQTKATVLQATPATWRMLLEVGWTGSARLKALCGGEALPPELANQLLPLCAELWNMYGPTETTIWSSVYRVQSPLAATASIGRPIANTSLYVLDAQRRPVPIGVNGELYIGGDGVARGYLNRPELTAEKFVADPFASQPGARLYRTGDLARFLPDGNIQFLGRADFQVKIRGFRIELGEIESLLGQHPAVQQAIVLVREDRPGDTRLLAYLIARPGQQVAAQEVRDFLKLKLPQYMVPSAVLALEAFPLTPNGKVDRRALAALNASALPADDATYVGPRDRYEVRMIEIWQRVLGIDNIGIRDNFFDLGGHSLLATQVVSRIKQGFAVELPLRALFEAPTVAGLAERVESLQRQQQGLEAPPIQRVKREQALPLSFAQQRLWFLDQLEPNNPLYNVPYVVRLAGKLNAAVLEKSLNEIVRRHESLRTRFETVNNQPVQVIAPEMRLPLEITNLTSLPAAERELEARRLALAEVKRPFHLSTGPLLRASLFKLADDEHVLVLNTHHIVSDGWSLGVLSQDLVALYEAFLANQPSPLGELPIQYADYSVWQREFLSGETLDKQLAYWKQQLAGAPASLDLPGDRPRPPLQSYHGAQASMLLPKPLLEQLKELSHREGVTFFMTLLAAFDVLLSRYSGSEDIVIGSPIAGRNRAEVEKLIGFFVNTLVLRADLGGDPSFRQLLTRVRETALGAYAHQDLPFEKLVEELRPERDLSRNPLFQVMLILQNVPAAGQKMADLTAGPFPLGGQSAKFDLTLIAAEKSDGLRLTFEYNTDLFDPATMHRMLGHLQVLFAAVAANPGEKISALPLLTAAERRQLLVDFNATAVDYHPQASLHQYFEAQVERTPEAVAVVFEQQQLSYGELNARANQLAHHLRTLGVGPDSLVGICAHRSVEMVVGLYGIMKAGGAYVPLDPDYPRERLAVMLDDARPQVLLTQQGLLELLPAGSSPVVCLDRDWEKIARQPATNPACLTNGKNLAYAIYTSGSTGKPKGVPNVHEAIINRLLWMQDAYPLTAGDRVLQKTPYSFDVSVWEFFWPLMTGAALVVARPEGHKDPVYLVEVIAQRQITTLHFVPSMLQIFLQAEGVENCGSLRRVFCSGEALPLEVQQRFFTRCAAELHNLYGPTEAAVDVTYWACRRDYARALVPIGRPIANTQIHLLDRHLQPVPVGVAGELHIGGIGLARGYLNRPELTAEKFIPDPFSAQPGARLYKTGDLARFLPDGNVEYLGRIDHQVKIRGFRIELGEIEAALDHHPGVRQGVVMAREDEPGNKRLVAYVLPSGPVSPSVEDMRAHLRTGLPEFMVPAAFVTMQSFPLSPNGKVDRKHLPAPEYSRPQIEYVAPRNASEAKIAVIWAEVLHLPQAGVHDDFFLSGGHSLLATQVVSRIRQGFEVELPLRSLFEAPTVAGLAERVESLQRQQQGLEAPPIQRVKREQALPLSFAQQRLWFLDQLEPNNPLYNVPYVVRLAGKLNAAVLEKSLNEIVRRHESLRTRFETVNNQPVQVIAPEMRLPLEITNLTSLPAAERELEARRLALAEVKRPFHLSTGPLLRASLYKLADDDHVLVLNTHHIISDRWSLGVLSQDLAALYEAFLAHQPSPLGELPIQYADYSVWQREFLSGQTLDKQLAYWKQQLEGAPASLDLPGDRPRPPLQSYHGAQASMLLPKPLLEQLKELSRREGVTFFMTLLAAFDVLLSRYSGSEDIVIGSPIAGRNRAEVEKLIGFFVNTLVLRADLGGDPSFRQLLTRVRETALGAYAHQDLPFEKLVEELRPERDLSRNPLFQVMLILQNVPAAGQKMAELTAGPFPLGGQSAKFDLTLIAAEKSDGLRLTFEYNTDLFDPATMHRMLGHLQVLFAAVAANPGEKISALPLLTAAERRQLLVDFNATAVDYHPQASLHQYFEAQVERTPEAVAVVFEQQQLSYGELNARANQLAHHLRTLGVGPDSLVGICAHRSVEMVVGLYGIMKAGGAYVPLDPDYPRERLAVMLDDARPQVLLTQQGLLELLPAGSSPVVCLDRDWEKIARQPATNPACLTNGKNLAYAIYTSGSTGKPKGVPNVHEAIINRLLWMQDAYPLTAGDRVLQKTPYSFDVSVWEFFWPLMTGAALVVARPEGHKDPVYLVEVIAQRQITTLHFVPSMLQIFLQAEGVENCGSLRRVFCSGEALPLEVQQRFFTRCAAELHNLYGPTEAAVDVTYWACRRDYARALVPIGRPIANTQIHLLDRHLQPVPVGVAGELHIGGIGLARGYLNRPELTAEKFIPDPFSAQPGARLYKTGDLARFLPDGNVEYLGRIDHQVKIRGFRIELGEIEAALDRHPGVRQGVVMAREDEPGNKRLVAYVLPSGPVAPSVEDMRAHLRTGLPEFMVPAAFVTMESFPLSPNGKVDRKHLPAPEYSRPQIEYVAPRNASEAKIAVIWAEVLHLPQAGVHDDFFLSGGHSLLATQVVSRIRQGFEVELPLRALFEAPTVAGLAERVEKLQRQQQGLEAPPMERVPREQALPLSFAQQRLWFLDQLEPNNPLYNVPYVVRLAGKLNAAVLEKSLNEIVRRHESLRTRFETVNNQPVQVIAPEMRLPLEITNLTSLPAAERELEARRLALAEVKRPFNLSTGPLLRASLFKLADDEHVLALNTHHIVSDGWSLGVLSQDLVALYEAFLANQPSPLGELPIQYADYSVWQREFLSGETLDKQLAYWKQQLAGAPASLDLPSDRPRPPLQSYHGAQASMLLPKPLLEQLKQLSRREGVTFFMTLLAAFDVLLSRYSGSEDIVIGSPIAGRNRAEVEKLIGFFVNTLVLRADLAGDPSFRQLLTRVRETALGAYAHQDLPFEKLVEELRPERDLSRNPLFQVMLILQNVPAAGQKMADLTAGPFPLGGQSAKFDLTLIAAEKSDGLRLTFEYNTDLFDPASIDRMLAQFEVLLQSVVADPAEKISSLTILTAAEKQQILTDWNSTQLDYPRSRCLHELFAEQAKQAPERVAVEFGEQQITYGELHARSNQLARYLQKRGVGPEVRVGLVVERSIDMVVGLLGILKAGGAYVPLDPAYPRERIAFVLQDAKSKVLVTQQSLLSLMPESAAEQIRLDADWNRISRESADELPSPVTPQNLAYVLYTSGSTGKPKGVQIEHRNLVNFLSGMRQEPGLSADDVLVAVTTLSFDIAGLELYLPLVSGAKVVLASREQAADGKQLLHLLEQTKATVLQATPATWRMLLEVGWTGSARLKALCGGEALPPELANQLLPLCAQLWNMYGPTETTIWSSVYRVQSPLAATASIGRPIANTSLYVLDAQRRPVPIGVNGELYIGGDGVARGYLNRPELTAEKFVADPFASQPGARLYRTGDLARFLPDGNIQFLGRADFQVKIRGFRIELGEIESLLGQHPAVQQAIVLVREDRPGDTRLLAYLIARPGQQVAAQEVRDFLKLKLPQYMVPSAVLALEAFPLTPNGKVDRRALAALNASALPADDATYVGPRDRYEVRMIEIWQRVLGIDNIGIRDNFFDLGGHSLLAVRLLSEIEKAAGYKIPLAAIFREATVEAMAAMLADGPECYSESTVTEIQAGQGHTPLFCVATPGVNTVGYFVLTRHLGAEQPIYRLQAPGFAVRYRPYTDREWDHFATEYIKAMRQIQPEGPYFLIGMCHGARAAFEMARRLEAEGQQVALLGIIDTWVLENTQNPLLWRIYYYYDRLRRLSQLSLHYQVTYLKTMIKGLLRRRKNPRLWRSVYWPGSEFVAPTYGGKITLFKMPRQPFYYKHDPEMGWGERARGGVEVHVVRVGHLQMLREPQVQILAAELRGCLQQEYAKLSSASAAEGTPEHADTGVSSRVR